MNDRMRKLLLGVAGVAVAAALAGGGVATASVTVDDERSGVTGPAADRATAAALEATGGGTANSVERDSENGAVWEVEVTKADGVTVDVRLDGSYAVVIIEGDTEDADSDEDAADEGAGA